jgi:tetratricopeptide (TPR) repeat protein
VEDWLVMTRQQQLSWIAAATLALSACTTPAPYKVPPQPTPVPPPQEQAPVETQPAPQPEPPVESPQPLPPPVVREPTLSAASRALVGQAQSQMASKNYAVAAASIERALRIEPDNALLWIELGKVRQSEGNYVQAENMGRKAVQMSANAPRANSAAWALIAESLRARGKNIEAQAAEARANALS